MCEVLMFGPFFVTLRAEMTENGRNSVTPPSKPKKGGGTEFAFSSMGRSQSGGKSRLAIHKQKPNVFEVAVPRRNARNKTASFENGQNRFMI